MPDPTRRLPTVRAPGVTSGADFVSGAAAAGQASASAFRTIANEAQELREVYQSRIDENARQQANEDLLAASEGGEDGESIRVALRNVVSQEDAVYNNTVRAGTLSRLNAEASSVEQDLRSQHEYDEEAFSEAWSEYIDRSVAASPDGVEEEVELLLSQYGQRGATSIRIATRERDTQESLQSVQSSLELNQRQIHTLIENNPTGYMDMEEYQSFEADRNALIEQLAAPQFGLSETDIESVRQAALAQEQEVVAMTGLDQVIGNRGFPAAYDEIEVISNALELNGEERRQFEGRATSHVARQEARANAERVQADRTRVERERAVREAQNRRYHHMRVAMADGQVDRGQIDAAYDAGEIDDSQWSSLILGNIGANAERVENQEILRGILNGEIYADPQNSDHRGAIDQAFRDIVESQGGMAEMRNDPALMRNIAISTVQETGIVAPTLQSMIRGQIASGAPEQVGSALDLLSVLGEQSPVAARRAFGDELNDAAVYAANVEAGVSVEEATAHYLRAQEARMNPATAAMREQAREISESFGASRIEEVLDRNPLPFFGRARFEANSAEMVGAVATYQRLFETAYTQYGNERDARNRADSAFRRVYGRTVSEGRERLMAYPPENFYPTGPDGGGWMQDQLRGELEESLGYMPGHIRLVSDGVTASEAQSGALPSYTVTYRTEEGTIAAMPGRYRFDPTAMIAEQREEIGADSDLAMARGRNTRRALLAGIENQNANLQERAVRDWLITDAGGGQQALAEFNRWRGENPDAPIAEFSPLVEFIAEVR